MDLKRAAAGRAKYTRGIRTIGSIVPDESSKYISIYYSLREYVRNLAESFGGKWTAEEDCLLQEGVNALGVKYLIYELYVISIETGRE